ncbi:MAG: magnesium transporter [Nocardioidaceae bacterium]|nr:magnesium transporter [Nocardioidaceae bacterium]MDX6310143.1 magnesium transporter [Nocardioidaceae bacterium]
MIIECAVYRHGNRVALTEDPKDLRAALDAARCEEGGFVWIGLHEPTADEMSEVQKCLNLHPLAVEDALTAHQRPKLERYPGDHVFMVLKTLWYVDLNDAVETGEIAVFVGKDFVVTVRHGRGGELNLTRRSLEAQANVLGHGTFSVLYSVCDHVVDEYAKVVAELQIDVDEIELSVFSGERTEDAQRIYTLKREVSEFRRAVAPLRGPLGRLSHGELPEIEDHAATFFRDVADHAILITEQVENLDGLLSSAHDAHMARISVQQNDDMRKISAWVAIAAIPTVVAGIYGMNFDNIPELSWHYGYYYALTLMAIACITLYRAFKHNGWL